ncbi:MAG: hypothetical protein KKE62_11075 [Proteobacteria bacterium]|nr:hypothetical protein [Pseudomonadota bacterium]MBU1389147.1 hypothetical protein [Pseudomonadota bacterium]MBU1543371.1 hypothetical protein [Pseudomonadota bacterium]MBU2431758.1 hypothetical protein [Pseudomonadota bacterium]MBU2481459.1 hypothetical protein [Pseudomonadota bacterium]
MKYFPLKTALACLLLAPLLYLAALNGCQKYTNDRYLKKIQNIFIGETKTLLEGRQTIEKQVAQNIYVFLESDWMVQHLGIDLKIAVTTQKGKFIYPTFINADAFLNNFEGNEDFEQIAKQNFDILNQGLLVDIQVDLSHGSNVANMILFACFSLALIVFMIFYKMGSIKAASDNKNRTELINGLQKEEQNLKQILAKLEDERQGLFENIKALNSKYQEEKNKLKHNEEELFDEIVSLEEQLEASLEYKRKKEEEIELLKSQIDKYERRKNSKNKRNEFDFIIKRFNVLYKNIVMNRKAVSGLLNLNEEQQIKAEEIVFMLDQNPDQVIIKRKVFSGKKHKTTCFEVLFSYNGRLYFKNNENGKIEVVVIGTKNTQIKDMEYLHGL